MKRYKFTFLVLNFICSVFFSMTVFSGEQQCLVNMPQTKLEVDSCLREGGVNILRLSPRDQPSYDTNLENLPTFIVVGKDLEAILRRIKGGTPPPYNNLIELPYPEAIMHFSDASAAAKLKVMKKDWKLLDMKDIVYGRQGGGEGAGLVCITLERETSKGFVVVSQCNGFYEDDILKLKEILGSIGD